MDEFVANKDKEFEDYCYEIAHQTSAANPAGIADEFVDWVLNLGA